MNILIIWEGGTVMFKFVDCIDAGTEYCPCYLAEKGECIICSQLRGKVFCDCLNWKGTCIFQEYTWNNNKAKKARDFKEYVLKSIDFLRDDLVVVEVFVNPYLAKQLNNIGAYVFLKKPQSPHCFAMPVSIMKSDIKNNIITMAIKILGVKTKDILECKEKVEIKGPYWNGVQGQIFLKNLKNSEILISARGVAASPCVMVANKLKKHNNNVIVILDKGRSNENFAKKEFLDLGCKVYDVNMIDYSNYTLKDEFKKLINELMRKHDFKVTLSGGSDEFHRLYLNYIYSVNKNLKFATVNNALMTCGEGVCGSCQLKLCNGQVIRGCKQQYNPAEVFINIKGDVNI